MNQKTKTSKAIGIDLGTTFSCVAGFVNGEIEVFPNQDGNRTTPSIVAFEEDGRRLVGMSAEHKISTDAQRVVYDSKRMIGRAIGDDEIQRSKKNWPFVLTKKGESGIGIRMTINGQEKVYEPVEISAFILGYMREAAEARLGHAVDNAVITVPARFNDAQKQCTYAAGSIAQFKKVRLLNEPTAAAIAYGYGRARSDTSFRDDETVMVFDLGGGTFDVSVLRFNRVEGDEGPSMAEVAVTEGDCFLGGVDFDNALFDYALAEFTKTNKGHTTVSDRSKRRLRAACERAKRTLSASTTATIDVECFAGETPFCLTVTRSKFEALCEAFFTRTMEKVKASLLAFGGSKVRCDDRDGLLLNAEEKEVVERTKRSIDRVILVGGSSRVPKIRSLLEDFFGASKLCYGVHPDEAVAMGAAYQAMQLEGDVELKPSESMLLMDVASMTISIETSGGVATAIINKNTPLPIKQSQVFTTYSDNQPSVCVSIYEGERPLVRDNHLLGKFMLNGIPPAPRGVPQIEITMELDVNGLLVVTAVDKGTNRSERLAITNLNGKLSPEEIKRMTEEAEKYKELDKQHRERMEARNNVDQGVYAVRSLLKGAAVGEAEKKEIEAELSGIEEWLSVSNEQTEKEVYEEKLKRIEELTSRINRGAQGGAQGPQGAGGAQGGAGGAGGPSVEEVD